MRHRRATQTNQRAQGLANPTCIKPIREQDQNSSNLQDYQAEHPLGFRLLKDAPHDHQAHLKMRRQ